MAGARRRLARPVYVVDGSRTPFIKARSGPGPFRAADLAVAAGRPLLARQPFEPTAFDEVVLGNTIAHPEEANIARVCALRLGCGNAMPAFTVHRNCASGMQAIDSAAMNIAGGRHDLVLAGGVDAMSHAPVIVGEAMTTWLAHWQAAKTLQQRLRLIGRFRPKHLIPVIALLKGLTDPVTGLSMGQTAEEVAHRFQIGRRAMDEFAARSHLRVADAQQHGRLDEVTPIYDRQGRVFDRDDGVRPDSTPEVLARLRPFFDKDFGKVTAGNSSQITDGAAWLILASEDAVKRHDLATMGRIGEINWAALDPAQMGLGPVHAATPILRQHRWTLRHIDYWEINEAFAGQVLACIEAWKDAAYCREQLGRKTAVGELDVERLNVDGGAIALGHPVGASGARIVLHLLHVLKRNRGKRGIAAICIGGGQGGATLVETE